MSRKVLTSGLVGLIALATEVAVAPHAAWAQAAQPVIPRAQVGRENQDFAVSRYVSATLPPTGHPTRFKQFAREPISFSRPTAQRPLSTYFNLLQGGDPAFNYYQTLRDQEIFNTAAQAEEFNTQLGGIRREIQRPQQQSLTGPEPWLNLQNPLQTPLQRKVQQQATPYQSPTPQPGTTLNNDILNELRLIRETLGALPKPQQ